MGNWLAFSVPECVFPVRLDICSCLPGKYIRCTKMLSPFYQTLIILENTFAYTVGY